ncbi:MAG: hypothetical protein H0V74_06515 [Chloroflexi bacterium]|nr:hypothetical protein [Chloroflexota bacterium]
MFRAAFRIARPTALLLAALVVGACVGTAGAVAPSPSPTPADPDRPVFSVTWEGGFVAPGAFLGRLPIITVYADGRVIVQGPQIDIYPGPLMPNLQVRTLSADALARLVKLARDMDLLRTVHYDFPTIADATDTVLTINLDGMSYRVSAYALNEAATDLPLGIEDDPATKGRFALRAFIDALTSLPASDYIDEEQPYLAKSIRIYAGRPGIAPDGEALDQPAILWPLADLATAGVAVAERGVDVRCQVVTGVDLATVLPLLQGANALSTFISAGEPYSLIVRPLLPGEAGC